MKIVIFPPIDDARLCQVRNAAGSVPVINCQTVDEAETEIVDATGFFGKITPALLARSTRLSWVQSPTASLEHYMFPELIDHPCQLSNMKGLFYDVIADHVMGYVLCIARNLHVYLRQQQQKIWHPLGMKSTASTLFDAVGRVSDIDRSHRHLADCTLGVVGVGSIGAEICRRAAAFGMTVVGVDPVVDEVPGVLPTVWKMDRLDDLLQQSDFVVIAAPHTPDTVKLFRTVEFEKMKQDAWLINIGRGVIVDLHDLTTALQDRLIGGAALDVFEEEPLPPDHSLWKMENVIITPHVAAASPRVPERHLETLLLNVRNHVSGKTPATLVNKEKWF